MLNKKVNNISDNKKALYTDCLKRITCTVAAVCVMVSAVAMTMLFSVKSVTINDGRRTQYFYTAKSASTSEILANAKLDSNDYTITMLSEGKSGTHINLNYTFPVYVTVGNDTKAINFYDGGTVAQAVALAGIELDEYDIVNMPLTAKLSGETYIDVMDISYVTESYTETVPFEQRVEYSSASVTSGITKAGSNGEVRVTSVSKVVNGVTQSTEIISRDVVCEAIDQVYTVGTKKDPRTISTFTNFVELDGNGNPVNYKKHMTVQATAYSSTGSGSASGMKLQPGCVAINTALFPYGTKFYIKSSDGKYIYGYAVAADTGGFVATRPTNFDLYFATYEESCAFGRRNIEVWVLE